MERRTRQSQAILSALENQGRPLLAEEVLESACSDVPTLSISTVYRQLKALHNQGHVRAVLLPGENPRYEIERGEHRHYFSCHRCRLVYDLDQCPGNLNRLAPPGFEVTDHEIILYGHCADCAAGR